MNLQIKRTIKATLIGLAISFAVAGIGCLSEGRINPLDPYWALNPEIIAHWVGRLGFIPLIVAIVVMITGFRKAGALVSVLGFLGTLVALCAVISATVILVAAAYPVAELPFAASGSERESFLRQVTDTCASKQKARPENRALSDASIRKFCQCFAQSVADKTKRADLEYQARHDTPSPAAVSLMTQAYSTCAQNVRD